MARIELVAGYIHNVHPGVGLKLTNRIYAGGDHPEGTVIERSMLTKVYDRKKKRTPPVPKYMRGLGLPVP